MDLKDCPTHVESAHQIFDETIALAKSHKKRTTIPWSPEPKLTSTIIRENCATIAEYLINELKSKEYDA